MKSSFSGTMITQKIKLYFNNVLQLCPAWALNRCCVPISVTNWGLTALLLFNKCSEAERTSAKNYIEKQLKNKLVSALISLPLFPFSQFIFSPWFLTSITIHCFLSHFSYKSLLKDFFHEAQKQKSFSAHIATVHKQLFVIITQIKVSFRSVTGVSSCCIWILFCSHVMLAVKFTFYSIKPVRNSALNFQNWLRFDCFRCWTQQYQKKVGPNLTEDWEISNVKSPLHQSLLNLC